MNEREAQVIRDSKGDKKLSNAVLTIKNVCKVESDSHTAKITVCKYSLARHTYISKSIEVDQKDIPLLIKLLEVANASR